MTRKTLDQWGIILLGVPAILLVNLGFQWGALFGLAGQFFWWRTGREHGQHGITTMCFVYGGVWCIGIVRWILGA